MKKNKNKLSFNDKGCEGRLVYGLSESEQVMPYLICLFEFEQDDYSNFNENSGEYEGEPWFLNSVEALKEISKFEVEILKNYFVNYCIYKVIDKDAYLNIWSMASSDIGIANATISGKSNINEVIKFIKNDKIFNIDNLNFSFIPWSYKQVYGGGSDEHFAVFYSNKRKSLDFMINEIQKLESSKRHYK